MKKVNNLQNSAQTLNKSQTKKKIRKQENNNELQLSYHPPVMQSRHSPDVNHV